MITYQQSVVKMIKRQTVNNVLKKKRPPQTRFAFIGVRGTTTKPEDFFAVFFDSKLSKIFFYNSCPSGLVHQNTTSNLKKYLPTYHFLIKKYKNQFENSLCSFFARNFLKTICYSDDPD